MINFLQKFLPKSRNICDLSNRELLDYSKVSYTYFGSGLFTGRLIFHGLMMNPMHEEMILNITNFYTESKPQIAVVLYNYLYKNIHKYDEGFKNTFMMYFSSAMHMYRLSEHSEKKTKLTIGEIQRYYDFNFDIEGLDKYSKGFIEDFGSLINSVYVIKNLLGYQVGFIEKSKEDKFTDYVKDEIILTNEYTQWINSNPDDFKKLKRKMMQQITFD